SGRIQYPAANVDRDLGAELDFDLMQTRIAPGQLRHGKVHGCAAGRVEHDGAARCEITSIDRDLLDGNGPPLLELNRRPGRAGYAREFAPAEWVGGQGRLLEVGRNCRFRRLA